MGKRRGSDSFECTNPPLFPLPKQGLQLLCDPGLGVLTFEERVWGALASFGSCVPVGVGGNRVATNARWSPLPILRTKHRTSEEHMCLETFPERWQFRGKNIVTQCTDQTVIFEKIFNSRHRVLLSAKKNRKKYQFLASCLMQKWVPPKKSQKYNNFCPRSTFLCLCRNGLQSQSPRYARFLAVATK